MSAPKANEAAVAAVQQALDCERSTFYAPERVCMIHDDPWTERGCPVAVAAADAAAPHIAAQTLRDAADEYDSSKDEDVAHWRRLDELYTPGGPSMPVFWLRDRADRIEDEL